MSCEIKYNLYWRIHHRSVEEPADMSKLALQSIVVGSILSEKATVVLAVLLQVLGCVLLAQIGVALLANPGKEITTGL